MLLPQRPAIQVAGLEGLSLYLDERRWVEADARIDDILLQLYARVPVIGQILTVGSALRSSLSGGTSWDYRGLYCRLHLPLSPGADLRLTKRPVAIDRADPLLRNFFFSAASEQRVRRFVDGPLGHTLEALARGFEKVVLTDQYLEFGGLFGPSGEQASMILRVAQSLPRSLLPEAKLPEAAVAAPDRPAAAPESLEPTAPPEEGASEETSAPGRPPAGPAGSVSVGGQSTAPDAMVQVATTTSRLEADILVSALRASGVEAVADRYESSPPWGNATPMIDIGIYVDKPLAMQAKEVIDRARANAEQHACFHCGESLAGEDGKLPATCPSCGSPLL